MSLSPVLQRFDYVKTILISHLRRSDPGSPLILLLFVLVVGACAGPGKDGAVEELTHRIYCSGSSYSWDTCYEKASQICSENAYDVIQKYEDIGAYAAYQSAQELPERRMIIQCRE